MKTRVVITGTGAITPIGNDMEGLWQGLRDKIVGADPITCFDITEYRCKLTAKVERFDPKQHMDAKVARHMGAFSQLAVAVSKETLEQSDIDVEKENPYRVGMCVGPDIDPLQAMEKDAKKLNDKGLGRMNLLLVPLMISSMATGNVAIRFGLKGKCFSAVTACAAGTHSIGEAFYSIQYGEADVMVVGGVEASITPVGIAGFISLAALNTTEDIPRASIPFDEDRNDFIIGEGASMIALKSLEHAKARGANILAEVVGYGVTCDTFHVASPTEDGSGAARAMKNAVKDTGITTEDIDYVSTHGTSAHHNDLFETRAIKLILRDRAQEVKINSTKSMVSHLLGAAGGMESVICMKPIQDGFVHATAELRKPGEGCDLDYTMSDGVSTSVDVAISSPLGSGGHNASLIVKKFSE